MESVTSNGIVSHKAHCSGIDDEQFIPVLRRHLLGNELGGVASEAKLNMEDGICKRTWNIEGGKDAGLPRLRARKTTDVDCDATFAKTAGVNCFTAVRKDG